MVKEILNHFIILILEIISFYQIILILFGSFQKKDYI